MLFLLQNSAGLHLIRMTNNIKSQEQLDILQLLKRNVLLPDTNSFRRYCLQTVLIVYLPTLVIVMMLFAARWTLISAGWLSIPQPIDRAIEPGAFVESAIVAPAVETIILALSCSFLWLVRPSAVFVAGTSALLWATLHGLLDPSRFLLSLWPFFVFSSGYLAWSKVSIPAGLAAAFVPHTIGNSLTLIILWLLLQYR